eukprot:7271689-Ditylum_brightwellii.AAC.1
MEEMVCYVTLGEAENQQDPCHHFLYQFQGLRWPRQKETVALDAFFPMDYCRKVGIPLSLKTNNAQ